MKKTMLSIVFVLVTILSTNAQSKLVEATFGVRGNCGMCKATIEKAAKSVEGVSTANWDKVNKKIDVTFDADKTSLVEIHSAIANSGYDTDTVKSNQKAYENLAGCCQYDKEMKMNIGAVQKEVKKGCCAGKSASCDSKKQE